MERWSDAHRSSVTGRWQGDILAEGCLHRHRVTFPQSLLCGRVMMANYVHWREKKKGRRSKAAWRNEEGKELSFCHYWTEAIITTPWCAWECVLGRYRHVPQRWRSALWLDVWMYVHFDVHTLNLPKKGWWKCTQWALCSQVSQSVSWGRGVQ